MFFAFLCGYIAYRGISGSTMTAIIINVIQITSLLSVSVIFIAYRIGHHNKVYEISKRDEGNRAQQHHPRALPGHDRDPAARRLRVGDRTGCGGDQPGEGHQAGHPAVAC